MKILYFLILFNLIFIGTLRAEKKVWSPSSFFTAEEQKIIKQYDSQSAWQESKSHKMQLRSEALFRGHLDSTREQMLKVRTQYLKNRSWVKALYPSPGQMLPLHVNKLEEAMSQGEN